MLANVATLLGLLGTIFGLIQAFEAVGAATAAEKQTRLAKGIAVAMITTATGLIVAIPSLVLHAVVSARQSRLAEGLEESTLGFFNFIVTRNRLIRGAAGAGAAAGAASNAGGLAQEPVGEGAGPATAEGQQQKPESGDGASAPAAPEGTSA